MFSYTQGNRFGFIEYRLQMELIHIIHEHCHVCNNLTTVYLKTGVFVCHHTPTQTTYRSAIINPFSTTNSSYLVGIIQRWVSTRPHIVLDNLLVWVNPQCPTALSSLGESECDYEDNSGLGLRMGEVLSECAVIELREDICNT